MDTVKKVLDSINTVLAVILVGVGAAVLLYIALKSLPPIRKASPDLPPTPAGDTVDVVADVIDVITVTEVITVPIEVQVEEPPAPDPMQQPVAQMTLGELVEAVQEIGGVGRPSGTMSQMEGLTSTQNLASDVYASGLITATGFPTESHPVRWAGLVQPEQTCTVGAACWLLGDPGVISYDHQTPENINNRSAVWTGGADVDNLITTHEETFTCPEGGYVKVTLPQAEVLMPQLGLEIEVADAQDVNHTILARCLYAEEGREESSDRSIVMEFLTEHPGRVKVMRYPVPWDAGGFFSQVHLEEDLAHGHGNGFNADNCGYSGCGKSYVTMVDLNHKTLTLFLHTVQEGWHLVYTNAILPNP